MSEKKKKYNLKVASKEDHCAEVAPLYHTSTPLNMLMKMGGWDTHTRIENIRNGMEFFFFEGIKTDLNTTTKELADSLKISVKTIDRRKSKKEHLSSIESEKLLRLSQIANKAIAVFEDAEYAKKWLKEKNLHLNNNTPLSMCDTEPGGNEVTELLGRIEYGVFA